LGGDDRGVLRSEYHNDYHKKVRVWEETTVVYCGQNIITIIIRRQGFGRRRPWCIAVRISGNPVDNRIENASLDREIY
jgi:hypothetical protein